MALKVATIKKYSEFDTNIFSLWDMIKKDPVLLAHFDPNHPFFDYELIDCSESLNYWVSLKGHPELGRVCGSAFVHDFSGVFTPDHVSELFRISFRNILRNLLISNIHGDTAQERWSLKFFVDGKFNPNRVTDYLKLCTKNLSFIKLQCRELNNAWQWFFSAEGISDFGFNIAKNYEVAVLGSEYANEPDRVTRDSVTNLLIRAFMEAQTQADLESQLANKEKNNQTTASLMEDLRKSVAEPNQVKVLRAVQRQASVEKAISGISVLPDGPTISQKDIHAAMAPSRG